MYYFNVKIANGGKLNIAIYCVWVSYTHIYDGAYFCLIGGGGECIICIITCGIYGANTAVSILSRGPPPRMGWSGKVLLYIMFFSIMMPWSLVEDFQCFGGMYYLCHPEDGGISSSEMLVITYQTTCPEDHNLKLPSCENIKSDWFLHCQLKMWCHFKQ
jgi:hypothetical protein